MSNTEYFLSKPTAKGGYIYEFWNFELILGPLNPFLFKIFCNGCNFVLTSLPFKNDIMQ